MNVLDALIIIVALFFAVSGYRRGVSWVAFSVAGLILGLIVGAVSAPYLAGRFVAGNPQNTATLAAAILLSVVLVFQGVGTAIGYRARRATLERVDPSIAALDSLFGSVLAIGALLASSWFLAITFRDTPFTTVSEQIQNSVIIRRLNSVAPLMPPWLSNVGTVLHGATFPNPFAGLAPQLAPIAVPPALSTPGITAAASETSLVLADACGVEAGSSWPLGNDYMVTNSHVVAGATRVRVFPPSDPKRGFNATVVLFDPETDIAVLHVPGIGLPALRISNSVPGRGLLGAAIGYPEGGPETTAPMAIKGTDTAVGPDIYNQNNVSRQIEFLAADIIPGDSGGPVVDTDGTVVGITFATARDTQGIEGYALTIPQISDDLNSGEHLTRAVSTQQCIDQ